MTVDINNTTAQFIVDEPMRYVAKVEEERYTDDIDDLWNVIDTSQDIELGDRWFTAAEAHIIEFALNAIASGRRLLSVSGYDDGTDYNGPTEGVAP